MTYESRAKDICGSGRYSYCQMYGDTCFKCSGKGKVYTKRAEAAMRYGVSLRTVKVQDVQVGMLLFGLGNPFGGKSGWHIVLKSELSTQTWKSDKGTEGVYWFLETSEGGVYTFPDSDVQAVPAEIPVLKPIDIQVRELNPDIFPNLKKEKETNETLTD